MISELSLNGQKSIQTKLIQARVELIVGHSVNSCADIKCDEGGDLCLVAPPQIGSSPTQKVQPTMKKISLGFYIS